VVENSYSEILLSAIYELYGRINCYPKMACFEPCPFLIRLWTLFFGCSTRYIDIHVVNWCYAL